MVYKGHITAVILYALLGALLSSGAVPHRGNMSILIPSGSNCICEEVSISGASSTQPSRMGDYARIEWRIVDGKPVYSRRGEEEKPCNIPPCYLPPDEYLFYNEKLGGWRVGPDPKGTSTGIKSTGSATSPHLATNWKAFHGGQWIDGDDGAQIQATCTKFTTEDQRRRVTNRTFMFSKNDRLAVIAIPKTGTRSLERFLKWHLPFVIPSSGCLYSLDGVVTEDAAAKIPKSTALLQPDPGAPGSDLKLVHVNVREALDDYQAQQSLSPNGRLYMTTLLRDPFERLQSEFMFGLEFQLKDGWSTPEKWRFQFWGQKEYTDEQLKSLQLPTGSFNGSRLEHFAEQSWVAAHNRQTRFIAGISDTSKPVTRNILDQAKRNLDKMEVIGTLENLEEYFADLMCVFGSTFDEAPQVGPWTRPYDPELERGNILTATGDNRSRKPGKAAVTSKFREAVYKNSWADLELFAYAKLIIKRKRLSRRC